MSNQSQRPQGPDTAIAAYMHIDESRWPHVHCVISGDPVSDEALLQSVELLGKIAQRGVRYTLLVDGRKAKSLDARQRRLVADASSKTAKDSERNCAGSAIVVGNTVVAGIITALQWIKPAGYPEKSFADIKEAERWLKIQSDTPRH